MLVFIYVGWNRSGLGENVGRSAIEDDVEEVFGANAEMVGAGQQGIHWDLEIHTPWTQRRSWTKSTRP